MKHVRIFNGALDCIKGKDQVEHVVLRGVVTHDSLERLQVGEYQREAMSAERLADLIEAYSEGHSVPDIILGMRGTDYDTDDKGVVILKLPVYIVDGLQRVTAAKYVVAMNGKPHVGVAIYFGTTQETEREMFKILNQDRIKISPSLLLRNLRHDSKAVQALYDLTHKENSLMFERVAWGQSMRSKELVTALTFASCVGALHRRYKGYRGRTRPEVIAGALDTAMEDIGERVFIHNVQVFFSLVDDAFGIQRISYRKGAYYMRGTFLTTLARVLSDNDVFWEGNRLKVDKAFMRKLAQFPVRDPNIQPLMSGGGSSGPMLYQIIIEYINKGRGFKLGTQAVTLDSDES